MAPNRKRRSYIRRFRDSSLFFIFLVIESQIVVVIVAIGVDFKVGIVVIVEQDVTMARQVSRRIYCLQEGRVSLEGNSADLTREQISQAYFGIGEAAHA